MPPSFEAAVPEMPSCAAIITLQAFPFNFSHQHPGPFLPQPEINRGQNTPLTSPLHGFLARNILPIADKNLVAGDQLCLTI